MTITNITEIQNPNLPKFQVIKENQDIYVPNIDAANISKRNGMIYVLTGSGGSGKTNLLLNLFLKIDIIIETNFIIFTISALNPVFTAF